MLKTKFSFFWIFFLLCSCTNTKWDRESFDGFTIEVPSYLSKSEETPIPGKLLLENKDREIYVFIGRENRADMYSEGMEFHLYNLPPGYIHLEIPGPCACRYSENKASSPEGALYMINGIIACGDDIYFLQFNTTEGRREDWYKEDFLRMLGSFQKL